jgi:hypothetical protein
MMAMMATPRVMTVTLRVMTGVRTRMAGVRHRTGRDDRDGEHRAGKHQSQGRKCGRDAV